MTASSFAAALAAATTTASPPPKGFSPGVQYRDGAPVAATVLSPSTPDASELGAREAIRDATGLVLPEDVLVRIAQVRTWGTSERPEQAWVKYEIVPRSVSNIDIDIKDFISLVKSRRTSTSKSKINNNTRIVAMGDLQIGKVDHRGGTDALIDRLDSVFSQIESTAKNDRCNNVVLVDAGDLIENFESGGSPMRTNDLGLPSQLEVAIVVALDIASRLAAIHRGRITIATVPSNHSAWRAGPVALEPGEDFGLAVWRTVARTLRAAGREVDLYLPRERHEDHVLVPVADDVYLGVVHGNQWRPNQFPKWFSGQVAGGSDLAAASMLVSGHYHHLLLEPAGQRRAADGELRDRLHVQVPTLDAGSSWFRRVAGADSEPGLLTWTVSPEGRLGAIQLVHPASPPEAEAVVALPTSLAA